MNKNMKTLTELDKERDILLTELARSTEEWARGHGCFRDNEQDEIGGFFIITSSKSKKNDKPVWTEAFPEDASKWDDVMDRMIALGIPIAAEQFGGHYIGAPGEQGKKVGTALNHMLTRAQTVTRHVELMTFSGDIEDALKYIQKRVGKRLGANVGIADFLDIMTHFLEDTGVPQQKSFAQLILQARVEESE